MAIGILYYCHQFIIISACLLPSSCVIHVYSRSPAIAHRCLLPVQAATQQQMDILIIVPITSYMPLLIIISDDSTIRILIIRHEPAMLPGGCCCAPEIVTR